jgi:hypothetical protein
MIPIHHKKKRKRQIPERRFAKHKSAKTSLENWHVQEMRRSVRTSAIEDMGHGEVSIRVGTTKIVEAVDG